MEPERSPKVDAYIAARASFARPILLHIRDVVHAAAPGIEESIKWSMPAFLWSGKLILGMAAFKEHAALNFWHGSMVTGGTGREDEAMGAFGRLRSTADLPPDAELAAMVRTAIDLVERGVVARHMTDRQKRPELPVPPALQAALDADLVAKGHWEAFSPSQRREYCEWVGEAKREATAAARIAQTVEWVASGKKRNWKYENC